MVVAEPRWTANLEQTLFARRGLRLVLAEAVAEARNKAAFASPDLIIAQRSLHDGLSDELCMWARRELNHSGLRFITMIPLPDGIATKLAREAGADEVIVQPQAPEALTPLVAQLLDAPLRKEIRVPAEIRVEGESSSGELQGLTRNVSASGAYIEISDSSVKPGDHLYIRLHLQGEPKPLVAKATCVRTTPLSMGAGLGVHFTRFAKDGEELLTRFLQAHCS